MKEGLDEFDELRKRWPWHAVLLKIILPLMVIGFVISIVGGFLNLASQPMKIANKTFQADNIIHNYEWFHDVDKQQKARVRQIMQFKGFLKSEDDKEEKSRLRMEMAGQQMSCRDLVAKYNANSEKINVGIFKGWSLPDNINPIECE